jgi:phosphatidylinositol kinase/protein kinase (PI-3  family)
MSQRLQKNAKALAALNKASKSVQKSIVSSAPKELVDTLCECAHNLLKGNVILTTDQYNNLKRYKTQLRELSRRRTSLKRKRSLLQKGGFLGAILSRVVPLLATLLGQS